MRSFFLGGEKGGRWIAGMFDTSSTSHGFTQFTFCNKSGSSHVTCKTSLNGQEEVRHKENKKRTTRTLKSLSKHSISSMQSIILQTF